MVKRFVRELVRERKDVGLTQFSLARASGVSRARISYAETGRLVLTEVELEKIRSAIRRRAAKIAATLVPSGDAQEIPAGPLTVAEQSEKTREVRA